MIQTNAIYRALFAHAIALALSALPVQASTITVTNLNDSGSGSLRDAIATAISGDTIAFTVTGTITLTGGALEINKNLSIQGSGPASLAVSGNNASTVFVIDSGVTSSISGVSVENASTASICGSSTSPGLCGGIYNAGTLTVNNSSFSGNSGAAGGGIQNEGHLTVTNSAFSHNSALGVGGGGIFNDSYNAPYAALSVANSTFSSNYGDNGGAIFNLGYYAVTVINCTFSGNSAKYGGGGIFGGAMITNATFSQNSASQGGGIMNFNYPLVTLKNTLLANSANGNCSGGTISSAGYNLSDDGSCNFSATGDKNNTPAGLDPNGLQNNGGPTETIALLPASPAVDAIPVSPVNYCAAISGNPVTTDQRGVKRPEGPGCDIGAFELSPVATLVYALTNQITSLPLSPQEKMQMLNYISQLPTAIASLTPTQKTQAINQLTSVNNIVQFMAAYNIIPEAQAAQIATLIDELIGALQA